MINKNDTRDIRYQDGYLMFPCGLKVQIPEKKVKWLYDIMQLTKECEIMLKKGVATIPYPKAKQIKAYVEKD